MQAVLENFDTVLYVYVRHIGILHLISISTISPQSTCHSALVCEIFIEIGPPTAEKNDVMSIFKMADLSHLGF